MFFAQFVERVNDVIRIFLQRIVHTAGMGGMRAIVIDPQPAANIHILDIAAILPQLNIEGSHLTKCRFDRVDVGDLATQMKMNHPDMFQPAVLLRKLQRLQKLRRI